MNASTNPAATKEPTMMTQTTSQPDFAPLSRKDALITSQTGEDHDTIVSALLARRDSLQALLDATTDAQTGAGIIESIHRVDHALKSVRTYL